MKVCWFADARSPHIHTLAGALTRLGGSVHVVTHKPAAVAGATVERYSIPGPGVANPRRWAGRRQHYLRNFLRRFDLVNVHFLEDWGFEPETIYSGCFVATAWGSDIVPPPDEHRPTPELLAARRAMLCHATAVTACGATFARCVADFAGLPRHRVEVVPFGVDLQRFQRGEARGVTGEQTALRVGYLKGFRAVYGPDTLIRAIPRVIERHPDTRFEFAGDGPVLAECQCLASHLGLDKHITWLGRVSHDDVPDLLGRWNISVISSRFEAFGVAALESSAMGVPVVASDVCGLRDTVRHGETGVLVPQGDEAAVAEAIILLLQNEDQRRRLGQAGRRLVEREFDLEHVGRQWVEMYERARDRATCMV